MAVKSIIDVEINDSEFKEFAATFEKYQKALAKTPKDWEASGKAQRPTVAAFQGIAAALLAQSALQAKRLKLLKDEGKVEKDSASYWREMVRSSREVAANASSIAKSVLSTIGIGTIFSGLLGAGGLFGLDALAGAVGNSRRSALGLGSTIGEKRAFDLNYGRIVDTGSVLGGVQEALSDVTKRQALYGAGLTEGDLAGKDAAQVAALLIPRLKALADRTPTALLGQVASAYGLGQFGIGTQELQRLQKTPAGEVGEYGRAFARDRLRLNVPDKQAKAYQDFYVQLSRAGEQIENVFVRGIAPLVPALTKFSESVVTTIANFADRLIRSGALDKFAGAIQGFADYLGTKPFQDNVKLFADDVVALGAAVHNALVFFGAVPGVKANPNDTPSEAIGGTLHDRIKANAPGIERGDHLNAIGGALAYAADGAWIFGERPNANNIGNLRPVGARSGFRRYNTLEGGIAGLAADLRYKVSMHHYDTLSKLIPHYSPKADHNDPVAYIKALRGQGVDPDARIDPKNNEMLARAMHAMSVVEKGQKNSTPYEVILRVLNGTGSNVVVSANQLRPSLGRSFQLRPAVLGKGFQ